MGDLDQRGDRIGLRELIEQRFDELEKRLDVQREADHRALQLQADEYARRLHDLNGEYQRDRQRQNDYVTLEKFEDNLKTEQTARTAALLRVDEKFEEYVKRYEQRQREVDMLLTAQKAATDAAQKAAEDEGRRIREQATEQARIQKAQADEQARKQSRNLVIVGLILTVLIAALNIGTPYFGP